METSRKEHWETVYETKLPNEVSWTQESPMTSLDLIRKTQLGKDAKIIDIGGGDSTLVDYLLEDGYENITVLDISSKALERAKLRLGNKASKVHWVVSDINDFTPDSTYDIWHDRATFHFLTTDDKINNYFESTKKWVRGFLIIGTFSNTGPEKCSGLDVKQYTEETLEKQLHIAFEKIKCIYEDHKTPFGTIQNFLFCIFKKR
jgi:cyclopropane fatty-acyl-phospholipid synthase-like methyltransferase